MTCPTTKKHRPDHNYRVIKKSFMRPSKQSATSFHSLYASIIEYDYDYEERLVKSVDQSGSLKAHYTELYVDGLIGEVTLEKSDYEVLDHTLKLEESGECSTTVPVENCQLELGLLPLRDDFTPESNDAAEKVLVDRPEGLDPEIESLVGDIFHRQFRERHRKRKLIRDYGMVDR